MKNVQKEKKCKSRISKNVSWKEKEIKTGKVAKKMKKYQLKYNNGTYLNVLVMSDDMFDIINYVRLFIDSVDYLVECSVWMDGKVLE